MSNTHVSANHAVGPFADGHHRVVNGHKDGNGPDIHVFVIAGPPPFGEKADLRYDFDVQIPIGPVVFGIVGYIDTTTLAISATFTVRVPILGTFTLGTFVGNLNDGISLTFGVPGILSGTAKIYISLGYMVYLDLTATVLGSHYGPLTIHLFNLPFNQLTSGVNLE